MSDAATRARRSRRKTRRGCVVAVTGIHGALGGALLARLEDDDRYDRVVLLDAQAPRRVPRRSVFHQVDLTEPLADDLIAAVLRSEQVEVLVHLALREAPIPLTTSAHELETVGTMYVLNAAASCIDRGSPLRALVTVTTAMVYGANARNPAYLCEDQPLRGAAHAGFVADKVDVETQLEDFRKSFHLPVCVLRPCWSVGSATSIAARLLTLRPCVTVLGFDPLMQLLHHDDLVAVLKQAIDDPRDGAFNVAGAGVLPLSAVLRAAGRMPLALPGPIAHPTTDLLWRSYGFGTGLPLDFVRYMWAVDTERARATFGVAPRHATRDVAELLARSS